MSIRNAKFADLDASTFGDGTTWQYWPPRKAQMASEEGSDLTYQAL